MNKVIFLLLLAVLVACSKEVAEPPPVTNNMWTNKPPVPIGGPDRSITLPDTGFVIMDGTRSYDPDGLKLTLNWNQISGPSPASFHNSYTRQGDAYASFSTSGKYLFKLTAEDDKYSVSDTVEINVKWSSECNQNREMVAVETESMGFSPPKIGSDPSYAVGSDQIAFAGGTLTEAFWPDDPATTYSSSVHLYDMRSNSWSEWEMLRPRSGMASVIAGNKLFLAGGSVEGGDYTDEVEIHDLATRNITKAKLSSPRIYLSVAAAGNKVVFAGGSDIDGMATDVVDIYDASTNTWSSAKISQPRMFMSVLVSGSKIYFAGGTSLNTIGVSNAVDIYDAVSGSWTVQRLSRQGSSMQTALFGNKMVLAGGISATNANPSTRVEFVDLATWNSSIDCLLFTSYNDYGPRGTGLNMAVIGDKIYFGSNEFINMYNSADNSWKHARVETYQGMLFTYKQQLYGFRYAFSNDGKGQYQVIRIGM